jgi:hypothetical protein
MVEIDIPFRALASVPNLVQFMESVTEIHHCFNHRITCASLRCHTGLGVCRFSNEIIYFIRIWPNRI